MPAVLGSCQALLWWHPCDSHVVGLLMAAAFYKCTSGMATYQKRAVTLDLCFNCCPHAAVLVQRLLSTSSGAARPQWSMSQIWLPGGNLGELLVNHYQISGKVGG